MAGRGAGARSAVSGERQADHRFSMLSLPRERRTAGPAAQMTCCMQLSLNWAERYPLTRPTARLTAGCGLLVR